MSFGFDYISLLYFFLTGQVIKAWDKGIATMKKDEVAVFTCKSEYAYGKQGSPPTIPPDATLMFEVSFFFFFLLLPSELTQLEVKCWHGVNL